MGNTYVVCGASGRVGSLVALELLADGHEVRVVGRDPDRLTDLAAQGATVRAGSLRDVGFLTEAMRGADAAFVLSPVDVTQQDVNAAQAEFVQATATAVRNSRTRYVVVLSSWGAELTEPVGGIIACHWLEQLLDQVDGLNAVHLRPVWFMENFLWNIKLIKAVGINGLAMAPDVSFPAIATLDIAAVAADYLRSLSFQGRTIRYLNGARDYTMLEVTRAIGEAIGRPDLRYVQLPDGIARKGMIDSGGLTPDAARLALEINHGISSGTVHAEPRSVHNSTPTTLEDFVRTTLAPAFHTAPDAPWRDRASGLLLRTYLSAVGRRAAVEAVVRSSNQSPHSE